MSRADIRAGGAYVELWVKNNRFVRGLQQARQRLNQFGSEMQAAGRSIVTVSAAMLIPIGYAAKTFANFDDAMRAVKAISQSTEEQFVRLTATAKRLGASTSFTAVEVASLMAELGRAGFVADEIDVMTESVLALSRATGTDATLSSGIMAATIKQFGLGATDAARVADGLTAAANKSFNTVDQLGEALGYAGKVAADNKVSLEDTLAILGGLGNVGIQGSMAGTTLKRLLTITGAEAGKLKKIFGVSFLDAAGNVRPLVDTLGEVNEATKDLGTGDRAKKFNEAFGLLGITGASAIGSAAGDIKGLADEIRAAGGIASDTAAEMDSGLGGAFRIIMSAAEGLQIAIGAAIEAPLKRATESMTSFLGVVTKVVNENQEVIVTFAKVGAAVGLAGVSLFAIGITANVTAAAIGGLMLTVKLTSAAVMAMLLPLKLVSITITLLAGAVKLFVATITLLRIGTSVAIIVVLALRAAAISLAASMLAARIAAIATTSAIAGTRMAAAAAGAAMVVYRVAVIQLRAAMVALSGMTLVAKASIIAFVTTAYAATAAMRIATLITRGLSLAMLGLRAAFVAVTSGAAIAAVATTSFATVGTIISTLLSPLVLAGAAVAALGYYLYTNGAKAAGFASAVGNAIGGLGSSIMAKLRPVFAVIKQMFGELKATAISSWEGISAALATGDLATAGRIAILGLRIAFAEGMESVLGLFTGVGGEIVSALVGQISSGDLGAAWDTIIVGLAAAWESFATSLGNIWNDVTGHIKDTWKSTVNALRDELLEFAAEGGIVNDLLYQISGVDFAAEVKRQQKLDAQMRAMGMNTSTDSGFKYKAPEADIKSANDDQTVVDNIKAADEARRAAARANIEGLHAEMDAIRAGMDAKKAAADGVIDANADSEIENGGKGGKGGAGGGGSRAGGIGQASTNFVTSSAAALVAASQGGQSSPMVAAITKTQREIGQLRKDQMEQHREAIRAMREGGGIPLV